MRVRGGNRRTEVAQQTGDASDFRISPRQRQGEKHHSPLFVQLIDGCLLSLLFIAPLLMGGRHPVGQFAWMLIAAVLGLATFLHYRPRKPSTGDFIWLAAAGLVILQLVPLPAALLLWLNPGLDALLPGMTDPAAVPFSEVIYSGRPISINVYQTRLALGMLLAYGIIFHSITRRVQSILDVRRLLAWVAIATVAIGILAITQRFAGNDKFLWVYQHISRSASDVVKGPFQNQNHLAQLMALGLGPLLYFATSRARHWKTALATSGATLCLLTGLLTFSRGGAIAIVIAALVTLAGLAYTGHVNRQRWLRIVLPTLITLVLLGIWGGENLLTRVETLVGSSELASVSPARIELWQSHLRAIAASPWVGYGAATHADIYPAFIEHDFGVKFTHGESGYLPIQLENGLLGTILLACALSLVAWWAWQSLCISTPTSNSGKASDEKTVEMRSLAVVCLAGLAASAVQSLGDFVWYIPACITPTLVLLACLQGLASLNRPIDRETDQHGASGFRIPWLAAPTAVLLAAVIWSVEPARASHLWTRYRTITRNDVAERKGDSLPHGSAYAETIPLLNEIIRLDPGNPVPRLRLAAELLKIDDGQGAQKVPSNPKLLNAAIRQSIIGLRSAPLQGQGYIWLTHASHRSGNSASSRELALLEQSLRVRPSDISTRYQAGLAAFHTGQPQWGLKAWKPVFETQTRERSEILRALAEILPADLLLQSFSLDRAALSVLYNHSRASDATDREVTIRVGSRLVDSLIDAAQNADDQTEAASHFNRASSVLQQIGGSSDRIIEIAAQAVDASPSEYPYRVRLTELLLREERWEDAKEHFLWCQSRKPRDPKVARHEKLILQRFQRR